MNLNAYEIIDRKKKGKALTEKEYSWVIESLINGELKDYQMTALLMAMFINGMNDKETAYYTKAMLNSGEVFKFKAKNIVDKHSTGGVGDKTSFILAPIAAAAGIKVPMIAGRGLGHTGGTVDKIEAIKGFNTNLTNKQFENYLNKYGLVLMGQTKSIAPADKIIYALRDVTATIDSVPIITGSIMSKKLAEGANGIVMDIKIGNGAFMQDLKQGRLLAKSILKTAKNFKKKSVCLLTNMNQPLGDKIGNSLEIIESIDVLKNEGPDDLTYLSVQLAAHMIHIGGAQKSFAASEKKAWQVLKDGSALKEFEKLIKRQKGDYKVIDDYSRLPMAAKTTVVKATKSGWLKNFDTTGLGFLCTDLGGGRRVQTDKLDYGVGFEVHKKIGDSFKKGEPLITIHHNKNQTNLVSKIKKTLLSETFTFSSKKVKTPEIIFETIK